MNSYSECHCGMGVGCIYISTLRLSIITPIGFVLGHNVGVRVTV